MIEDLPRQPAAAGRLIMRLARKAALATIGDQDATRDGARDGKWPRASLVTTASDCDGSPILLLSHIALHSRDIRGDQRVSLLFEATGGYANPQEGPRISLMGRAEKVADARFGRRFLARHPGAALYASFADFNFYRLAVERAYFVGGLGIAVWIEGAQLLLPEQPSRAVGRAEESILAEMNGDGAPLPRLLGSRILGRRGRHWRMIAVDPEGCELRCGTGIHRLRFAQQAANGAQCRRAIAALAGRAAG